MSTERTARAPWMLLGASTGLWLIAFPVCLSMTLTIGGAGVVMLAMLAGPEGPWGASGLTTGPVTKWLLIGIAALFVLAVPVLFGWLAARLAVRLGDRPRYWAAPPALSFLIWTVVVAVIPAATLGGRVGNYRNAVIQGCAMAVVGILAGQFLGFRDRDVDQGSTAGIEGPAV